MRTRRRGSVLALICSLIVAVSGTPFAGALHTAAAEVAANPFGHVDSVAVGPGRVTVAGWAIDPDTPDAIIVQVYLDRSTYRMAWADVSRPDVGAVFPEAGPAHGFEISLPASPGGHEVCVYAINTGPGSTTPLGCSTVMIPSADPLGRVDSFGSGPGIVTSSGWALDPDTTGPIIVQMYVDGTANAMAWANLTRPDIGAVFPDFGPAHGFSFSMAAAPGSHRVCVYAVNVGAGSSSGLGCATVTVPSSDPFGNVESVSVAGGAVTATGWAIDPDTSGPIIVQMYVDGSAYTMGWAALERPDLAAAFPWAGPNHGFSLSMAISAGPHTVCLYGVNVGAGRSSALGCRTVGGPPFFVYGSLRHGESGYYLLEGKTTAELLTRMPQLDLYRLIGSSYPYAVDNPQNATGVVGEAMSIVPSLYWSVLASLDRYERYDPALPPDNQVYVRTMRPTREGTPSWVYEAGPRQAAYLRSSGIHLTSGDWLRW